MDFFLQISGLAYFIFALWNLRLAVLLLPLFFAAYLLKFDFAGIPFPIVEVFIYGTVLACIFSTGRDLFKKDLTWKELIVPYRSPLWIAAGMILLAAVVSTFIAPQSVTMMDGNTIFYGRKVALGILKSWIVAPLLMFMLFAWVMRTKRDFVVALNSYAAGAVVLAGWGVYQVLTGHYLTPDARASGPFNSANYLALFITPALFYALVRLQIFLVTKQESWWTKLTGFFRRDKDDMQRSRFVLTLLWGGGFLLLFFALLFTKSYAAFLAFFVACILWFRAQSAGNPSGKMRKFSRKILLGAVVGIVVVVGTLILLDTKKWDLFFQLTTRTSSGVRVEIYTIAAKLIAEHPFQGIGLGMFPAVYQLEGPRILGHDPYEWNMLHPHDVFLAFWLNLGLLGLLSFLWIIKICFQKSWPLVKKLSQQEAGSYEWLRVVGLMMILIILVHGLVDTPFFKNDLALLFWLVVATVCFPKMPSERK